MKDNYISHDMSGSGFREAAGSWLLAPGLLAERKLDPPDPGQRIPDPGSRQRSYLRM